MTEIPGTFTYTFSDNELVSLAISYMDPLPKEILHEWSDDQGTVALVYIGDDGAQNYAAQEFVREFDGDEEVWSLSGGYTCGKERYYMGERYRSREMWGHYYDDIF